MNFLNKLFSSLGDIFGEFVDLIIFIKNVIQFLIIVGLAGGAYYVYLNWNSLIENLPK